MDNNIKFHIDYNTDSTSFGEAISEYSDVQNGYTVPMEDLILGYEDYIKFENEIYGMFDTEIFDYSENDRNIFKKGVSDSFIIYSRGNLKDIFFSVHCKDDKTCSEIFSIYKSYLADTGDVQIYKYTYSFEGGKVQMNTKVMQTKDLGDLTNLYYPYINTNEMFKQYFTGRENIMLLVGKSGIGKSKLSTLMLQYALDNPKTIPYDKLEDNPSISTQHISVGYIKSNDVVSDDSFWRSLEKQNHDFVILDDLDYMLTDRQSEITSSEDVKKNSFLNQLLSYTDGIEHNKTKFIITTNQTYDGIDKAILRKGRLFDILELRDLTTAEAKNIWESYKLDIKDFNKLFSMGVVLPAELGSEISKKMNDRIEDAGKRYVLEDNISKLVPATKVKSIGIR